MKADVSYDYASGDLLENRNTYFYTRFEGDEFLAAWRAQRSHLISSGSAKPPAETEALADGPIQQLLEDIALGLKSEGGRAPALALLERLLQRFEVTKRLHGKYNANWRPTDSQDYRGVERYVRLAEVLDAAYDQTSRLQFLNALLKCMDILSSMAARLDSTQQNRLHQLAIRERDHVERLIRTVRRPASPRTEKK